MNIRKLTISDYEDIYQLWKNTPGMGLRSIDDSEEGIKKYLNRNPETCFVAEMNGIIKGVILCGHDGRRGYIHHTAIDLSARKNGIGTALVNAATQALKELGINKVALVTFRTNDLGNYFWEAMEFVERSDLVYRNKCLNTNNI